MFESLLQCFITLFHLRIAQTPYNRVIVNIQLLYAYHSSCDPTFNFTSVIDGVYGT